MVNLQPNLLADFSDSMRAFYDATAELNGIPDEELEVVAPNLANFAVRDLGFLT